MREGGFGKYEEFLNIFLLFVALDFLKRRYDIIL